MRERPYLGCRKFCGRRLRRTTALRYAARDLLPAEAFVNPAHFAVADTCYRTMP